MFVCYKTSKQKQKQTKNLFFFFAVILISDWKIIKLLNWWGKRWLWPKGSGWQRWGQLKAIIADTVANTTAWATFVVVVVLSSQEQIHVLFSWVALKKVALITFLFLLLQLAIRREYDLHS